MNGDANPSHTVMNGVSAGAAVPSGKAMYEQRKQYGKLSVNSGEISQYNVEVRITQMSDRDFPRILIVIYVTGCNLWLAV